MIIDLIMPHAGMGNQLFMYAAGLAVSQRLKTELVLDTWGFNEPDVRGNFLDKFPNITKRRAKLSEIWKFAKAQAVVDYLGIRGHSVYKHPFRRLLFELMQRTGTLKNSKVYSDSDSKNYLNDVPDNIYLSGFWGSEKYFADVKDLVREKFKFSPDCFNPELLRKIQSCNSVAIHVRRSDKVNNKGFFASDGNYINHAVTKIKSLTQEPQFFVFSDDIQWCRENLSDNFTFIDGQTAQQDLALMSQCKHVIMGPSTFSWWAAWLNNNPNKIIIAPDLNLWLKGQTVSDDFLPSEWIKCD